MNLELVTVLVLALIFVLATARSVNLGVLALVAAFGVGAAAGLSTDEVFAGFPVDLFVALTGLTFLFGFAQRNGTIDLLLRAGLRLVRGQVALAPWIFFALTGALMSVGAIFAIAVVAPLAVPFARRYRIDQLMMGMMVVHGGMAGAFSPLSVYGLFVNSFLAGDDLGGSRLGLFLASFVFNTVIALIVFLTMGGRSLLGRTEDLAGAPASEAEAPGQASAQTSAQTSGIDLYQGVTLLGLAVMAVGTAAFGLDIGVLSLSAAAVLALMRPDDARVCLANVSWSTVVLVGGVLTYIAMLEAAGTVEWASGGIAALGVPLVAALLLCYLAGIVSALASSIGTIGVALAIAAPMLESGELGAVGFVAALSISATVVDVSPFSTNGALVLANVDAEHRDDFYRRMLVYAGLVVGLAPLAAWTFSLLPV
ncbi:SLC13 family permease [Nocardioides bruguierae]|uniref:SLC13 family permease n=1 Tax=Nocardioides bruguierae TaxID=2945102 RepID=UPI002022121F|nr:SLC13 family permease [Nocardioides bruguierae]MCL8026434.1 SLC13 family permease [Nocardioides bruguierae]